MGRVGSEIHVQTVVAGGARGCLVLLDKLAGDTTPYLDVCCTRGNGLMIMTRGTTTTRAREKSKSTEKDKDKD